ncbi:MAG: hypothetical protein L3K17_00940 [Thermoplasmata archaeon]|nr:hypothetical protein [Thermoplasmata archaeon]
MAEPIRTRSSNRSSPSLPTVRRVGRLRLPLAGPYRPWATLYLCPDGRTFWTVRLWEVDRPVRRVYSTAALRGFARAQRLDALLREIDALVRAAEG